MVSEQLIRDEYQRVAEKYKKLKPPERYGRGWKIDGLFDVVDSNGHVWDTYGIRILLPINFPYELPILIETSGKVERHEDWHNVDGACCLATYAMMYKELGVPISLVKWLDRFVHDFLANHVIRLKDGAYPKGEYAHGTEGILAGYKEIFELNTNEAVLNRLRLICGQSKIGRNDPCFCGSGKKYKKCFLQKKEEHYLGIPLSLLSTELAEISGYLRSK